MLFAFQIGTGQYQVKEKLNLKPTLFIKDMERTEATIKARTAAESKGLTLESLVRLAIDKGLFPKYGIGGNYSFSWVDGKLRANNGSVANKLSDHANTL